MNSKSHRRLALVLPSLRGGGAERVMLNVAEGLAKSGYQVDLLIISAKGELTGIVPPNITIHNLNKRRALSAVFSIARYLRRCRFDLIISVLPHVSVITIIARIISLTAVPVLVSEHNTLSQSVRNSTSFRGRVLLIPILRILYRLPIHIVAVSSGVRDDLADVLNLNCESLSVIYNPVLKDGCQRHSLPQPSHPWFKEVNTPIILGAGRLTAAKNFSLLIAAFESVRKVRDARLIIIGEGTERKNLEHLIEERGLENSVDLVGFVHDAANYMFHSNVFALSSNWEGLPTVLVEALSLGVPIVSTDCPSGPGEILRDALHYRLVSVGDLHAFSTALLELLDAPHEFPSDSILKKYSQEFASERYATLIEQLCNS